MATMTSIKTYAHLWTTIVTLLISIVAGGEDNWVSFIIDNRCTHSIFIDDVHLDYGKWYKSGLKAFEYRTVKQEIAPSAQVMINACGRMLSPTGTNGQFAIFNRPRNDTKSEEIAFVIFDITFAWGGNELVVLEEHPKYKVSHSPPLRKGHAMGFVRIRVEHK